MVIDEFPIKEYVVIGKWVEPDGREEWEIINNNPQTYEEALKIAVKAGRMWEKQASPEYKNLSHEEIPIKWDTLQEMLRKEKNL